MGVCNTIAWAPLSIQGVELLGNRSTANSHLQIQLAQILIEKSDCYILRAHIRRVSRPWHFSERQ